MAIITLTTDWNKSDYYLGSVKGKILTKDPATQIVDISHQVQPFNLMQAAFIIRNCCSDFPVGTIHIIAINAALSQKRSLLIIESKGQYFITSDNGLVGLLTHGQPDAVYRVSERPDKQNFLSLDIFIETAFNLIGKKDLQSFCERTDTYESQIPYRPVIDKNLINGSVIYIDSFSNAITNISKETFMKVGNNKAFEIYIQSNHYKIDRLNQSYSDSLSGELLGLFNSVGLLEIAINHGNAAELLNLSVNSAIRIKFYDEKPDSKLTLTGG
ncbi:MAG: SAM-dependent chlorinase/fluorinase [Bacteroidales bacterium]|nr:SAM-dependent chlorinase/fluorinase [Bacteroidales bacterium]